MADYSYDDLDRLLVQVRRIEEHRVKGAEQEIKETYEELLQELRHYLADTYSQYAEDDRLTYGILQKYGYYARFLEEVERKIDSISPAVKQLIRSTVEMTYAATYDGLVEAVKKAAGGAADLGGLKGCTPDVMKKAVENPVSKLTLDDRLEKHRKEIVYDIKQNISVGLMNGDRYSTVANRIKQSVNGDYKKAIRITRTETHRVRQAGEWESSMEADKQLQENGSTMRITKTWRTMKDERVRPAKRYKTKKGWKDGKPGKYDHKSMEGVTLPVDEEFKLPSGATTQYPGGSGVAGEDINCRCYLSYKLQRVSVLNDMGSSGQGRMADQENQGKYQQKVDEWGNGSDLFENINQQIEKASDHDPVSLYDIRSKYREDIVKTVNSAPENIRKFIEQHRNEISFINEKASIGAREGIRGIRVNLKKDFENQRGRWSSTFHEIGHRIDRLSGRPSAETRFEETLRTDFENLVKGYQKLYNKNRIVAYEEISQAISGPRYHSVSDLFGGISGNQCVGSYAHREPGYWQKPGRLGSEAFAHFFEAVARNDTEKTDILKQSFPEAFKLFEKMMEGLI